MSNRHERRAAEARARAAQADQGFDDYKAQIRRIRPKIGDRELGEAWMRGQAFTASGAESVVIHKLGEQPQRPAAADWCLSLAYGSLSFKAFMPAALFDQGVADIQKNVIPALQAKGITDLRAAARQYLLDMLIENKFTTDGNLAAQMAATFGWLVKTSEVWKFILQNESRALHYEISTYLVEGRRAINFRLVAGQGGTIPNWVRELPPTSRPGEPGSLVLGTDDEK